MLRNPGAETIFPVTAGRATASSHRGEYGEQRNSGICQKSFPNPSVAKVYGSGIGRFRGKDVGLNELKYSLYTIDYRCCQRRRPQHLAVILTSEIKPHLHREEFRLPLQLAASAPRGPRSIGVVSVVLYTIVLFALHTRKPSYCHHMEKSA